MIETTYHVPGVPSLALLSDSHNVDPSPILASVRRHAPSLICISGDFVYGNRPEGLTLKMEESRNAMELLSTCAAIAPTYVSLGNHEWMLSADDLRLVSSTGAVLLDNEWASTVVGGKDVVIGGLTSAKVMEYRRFRAGLNTSELYPKMLSRAASPEPDTSWLDGFCSSCGFHILLSHHPEYWPLLSARSIDLILSGHAHGGQWRVFNPFRKEWHGLYAPSQGFWPRYTSGVIGGKMVVSRGLANTIVIPRLCNPVEVVYVEP